MSNSGQLEREAEQTRAQIADTLEELRARITPGQVIDQLVDYTRDGGAGDFVRNLGRQTIKNPLPVCLLGASLAWLMLSNGKAPVAAAGQAGKRKSDWTSEPGDQASDAVASAQQATAERAKSSAAAMGARATEAKDRLAETAASLGGAASSTYAQTKSTLAKGASAATTSLSDSATSAYDSVAGAARRATGAVTGSTSAAGTAGRNFVAFCREQPIVLTGIGLALGATIGAALASTEVEDRLMGEASDEAKQQAQEFAEDQYEKGKAVAADAVEEARQQAEQKGLSPVAAALGGSPPDKEATPVRPGEPEKVAFKPEDAKAQADQGRGDG
jgi:hypothetical protein